MSSRRNHLYLALAAAWCVLVGFGVAKIFEYTTTESPRGEVPFRWPADSLLPHATDRATLTMFVHPECPCSRASLSELASIMSTRHAAVTIVFAGETETSALWDAAMAIPGARRIHDPHGVEAARFGVVTSGHVVIFDADGVRSFTGGITGSRGHVGDNMGRRQVEEILDGRSTTTADHAVFGCALEDAS